MGYNSGITTMGGRAGGGARGGGGAGRVSSAQLQAATQSAVSGFNKFQKGQYNAIVKAGYKPAVAAANVSMFPKANFKKIISEGSATSKSRLNGLSNAKLLSMIQGT